MECKMEHEGIYINMKVFTAIIGGLALAVAGTAAFFSVRGIGLLFAGAAMHASYGNGWSS